mgnify:CR=1 FL=1
MQSVRMATMTPLEKAIVETRSGMGVVVSWLCVCCVWLEMSLREDGRA